MTNNKTLRNHLTTHGFLDSLMDLLECFVEVYGSKTTIFDEFYYYLFGDLEDGIIGNGFIYRRLGGDGLILRRGCQFTFLANKKASVEKEGQFN